MKQIFYALLISAAVLTTGCNKNGGYPKGEGSVNWNGEQWKAKNIHGYISNFDDNCFDLQLVFESYSDHNNSLYLQNIRRQYGRQRFQSSVSGIVTASYHSREEYDVLGDAYKVFEADSLNNWVEITEANSDITKEIKGRFNITMLRYKKFPNSPFPDTVRFTNGSFYISKLAEID